MRELEPGYDQLKPEIEEDSFWQDSEGVVRVINVEPAQVRETSPVNWYVGFIDATDGRRGGAMHSIDFLERFTPAAPPPS